MMADPQASAVRRLASFRGGQGRADDLRWISAASRTRFGVADQKEVLQPMSPVVLETLLPSPGCDGFAGLYLQL